ncbi:hypothetical protein ACFQ3Z_02765 [Streptomyces nogalater]
MLAAVADAGALGHTLPAPLSASEDFGRFAAAAGCPSVFFHFGGADPAGFDEAAVAALERGTLRRARPRTTPRTTRPPTGTPSPPGYATSSPPPRRGWAGTPTPEGQPHEALEARSPRRRARPVGGRPHGRRLLGRRPAPTVPACAWEPLGYQTSNVAYPDTNARYWLLRYTVREGLTIRLDGRFPDARYASVATYDARRSSFTGPGGTPSALTDHQLLPDRGSRNPYREPARPGGKFTVTVAEAPADRPNALPLAPAALRKAPREPSSTGSICRTGVPPAEGHLRPGRAPRPGGDVRGRPVPRRVHRRASTGPSVGAPSGTASPAGEGTPPRPAFSRSGGDGLYPNPDNAYLSTGFEAPPAYQVLVVRGKAPTATAGDRARPWPAGSARVRYWSMCDNLWWGPGEVVANPLPGGGVDPGCRADFDTRLSSDGTYTYAVGTEDQRAAVERVPGVTFLPLSSATPTARHLLILRNMVAAPGFAEAIQRVPVGSGPARTAEVMGAYYPEAAYCDLGALARSGPDACTGS